LVVLAKFPLWLNFIFCPGLGWFPETSLLKTAILSQLCFPK
jgi:hypothetical protein